MIVCILTNIWLDVFSTLLRRGCLKRINFISALYSTFIFIKRCYHQSRLLLYLSWKVVTIRLICFCLLEKPLLPRSPSVVFFLKILYHQANLLLFFSWKDATMWLIVLILKSHYHQTRLLTLSSWKAITIRLVFCSLPPRKPFTSGSFSSFFSLKSLYNQGRLLVSSPWKEDAIRLAFCCLPAIKDATTKLVTCCFPLEKLPSPGLSLDLVFSLYIFCYLFTLQWNTCIISVICLSCVKYI